MAFGGNFYALLPAADAGAASTPPPGEEELVERRAWRSWRPSTPQTAPVHPGDPRISAATTSSSTSPAAEPDSADGPATSIHPVWLDPLAVRDGPPSARTRLSTQRPAACCRWAPVHQPAP
jgi:proline racemase